MSAEWHDYLEGKTSTQHTVSGKLRIWRGVFSPQLNNTRDIYVYLPPSHGLPTPDGQDWRRFPVIYMHDGQNLFDRAISYADEWRVDETLESLTRSDGLEAIVVGIPNIGERRLAEYSPFKHPKLGGGDAAAYLRFIVETIKPQIDRDFATLPGREATGIIGSSMGGLVSTYAFFEYPQVFGIMGALSPAFWFASKAIVPYLRTQRFVGGRVYLDVGTAEMGASRGSSYFRHNAQEVCEILAEMGYQRGVDLLFVEDHNAPHSETAWARRLPDALRFLFGQRIAQDERVLA